MWGLVVDCSLNGKLRCWLRDPVGVSRGCDSGSTEVQALPWLRSPRCWGPLSQGMSFLDLDVWASLRQTAGQC